MIRRSIAIPLAALALLATSDAAAAANPFAGAELYVDPNSNAARQADEWRFSRPLDAMAMERIAQRSQADWFGDWNRHVRRAVDARVSEIAAAGSLPVLVAYAIPERDCGGHSGGGERTSRAYLDWIRGFARGIGRRRAAVVLEPDALAAIDCLARAERRQRLRLLRRAVRILGHQRAISVYIDAGHSGWQPRPTMIRRLRRAGIADARGFALNVSNFRHTATELAYGRRIARALGRTRFVIDTSRNGLGPAPGGEWCNPSGRGLGHAPTAETATRLADAYLWIKRPGESDGSCNGGPPAGVWWPEYALGLARRAQTG